MGKVIQFPARRPPLREYQRTMLLAIVARETGATADELERLGWAEIIRNLKEED